MRESPRENEAEPLPTSVARELEAGAEQDEPLTVVLDDIQDYAVFIVDLDGRIASWNHGGERLKGYTEAEAIGLEFAALFTAEDRAKGQPAREMKQALERGVYQGEGKRRRKDGSIFDADVTLRLMRDKAGRPRGFVKVTRDITERKKLEKVLRDRSEFAAEFMGIASHDLRNPLNAIVVGIELLKDCTQENPRLESPLRVIKASVQRASRLVHDLLDFTQARLTGGLPVELTPFDVHQLAKSVVEELRLANPNAELILETAGDGRVEWDPDRIGQMITNLASNAVQHGEAGSPIRVGVLGEADSVTIAVHNRGKVIPPEEVATLFDRLVQGQGRERRDGSIGLGLYISNHVARAHGSAICVDSSSAAGTTFHVRIPRRVVRTSA